MCEKEEEVEREEEGRSVKILACRRHYITTPTDRATVSAFSFQGSRIERNIISD